MYNNCEYHKCECEQKIKGAVITLERQWEKKKQLRGEDLLHEYYFTNVLHLETITNRDT